MQSTTIFYIFYAAQMLKYLQTFGQMHQCPMMFWEGWKAQNKTLLSENCQNWLFSDLVVNILTDSEVLEIIILYFMSFIRYDCDVS